MAEQNKKDKKVLPMKEEKQSAEPNQSQVVNNFVSEQLDKDDVDTAIAITKNGDNVNLSYNSKGNISNITNALAALIESQAQKDPLFRHEFLKSLGLLNGKEGMEVAKVLQSGQVIKSPEEAQNFINDVMNFLQTEIRPTGLALMITNADPEEVQEDPTTMVPFIYHITGSTNLLAYGIHNLTRNLSGAAYANHEHNAMSPHNGNNATAMRLFSSTMDTLNALDKKEKEAKAKGEKDDK